MKRLLLIVINLAFISTSLIGQELFFRATLTLETRTTTKELDPKTKEILYLSKALIRPGWPSMLYIYEPDKDYYVIKIDNIAKREFESTQSTKRIEWKGIGIEVSTKKEYLVSIIIQESTSEVVYTLTDDEYAIGFKGKYIVSKSDIAPDLSEELYEKGVEKLKNKDYNGAIQDFSKVIAESPNIANAYINRGIAKRFLGDDRGAINDYNKAIELDRNNSEAYFNRAYARGNLGNRTESISDYNKAIEIDPKYKMAYYNRGLEKIQIGDISGALSDFNSSISIDPNFTLAYVNRGIIKMNNGDQSNAKTDFNKAIANEPNNGIAFFNRGIANYNLGLKDDACNDWKKAKALGIKESDEFLSKYCN